MTRPEDAVQIALVDYLRRCGLFVFHVKNQGQWSVQYGRKLNRMGRTAGMPDLQVLTPITPELPRGVVMVEVKAPPKRLANGKLSQAKPQVSAKQEAVIKTLGALGIPTLVVRSVDEAEAALRALGVPLRGRTL